MIYSSVEIAQKINKTCKNKEITAKNMLEILGYSKNTISEMLHGRSPSVVTVAKIADYLGVSVDYLLGRTDNPEVNR